MKIVSREPENWHTGYRDGLLDCAQVVLSAITDLRLSLLVMDTQGQAYIDLTLNALEDALLEQDFPKLGR